MLLFFVGIGRTCGTIMLAVAIDTTISWSPGRQYRPVLSLSFLDISMFSSYCQGCQTFLACLALSTICQILFFFLRDFCQKFKNCWRRWCSLTFKGPRKSYRRERLSTVDLLKHTSKDQLLFMLQILYTFFTKTSYFHEEANCTVRLISNYLLEKIS